MGGHVYRYFDLEYMSPTIGLYFYTPDYIKFLNDLKWYLDQPLQFIDIESSRYKEDLIAHGNTHCPIGLLHDIEIVFLHYKSRSEALEKWNRRKARINWDNIYVKMTQQNLCTEVHLKEFDNLPYVNKFVFTVNDYRLKSHVIFCNYMGADCVRNDTVNFRKFINLTRLFNNRPFRMRQPKSILNK